MNNIITCGTSDPSSKPCTLADLMSTTNNLATFIITHILPGLVAIGVAYTVISLLINMDKPDGLKKAKKNVTYILWGSFFTICAWSLMRLALNLIGWNGDISNPLGYILGIETVYAAPFVDPIKNPDVAMMLDNAKGLATVLVSVALAARLIWTGIQFIMYSDNPEKLKNAKKWLLITVVAGILYFSMGAIYNALNNSFNKLDTSTKSNTPTKSG